MLKSSKDETAKRGGFGLTKYKLGEGCFATRLPKRANLVLLHMNLALPNYEPRPKQ